MRTVRSMGVPAWMRLALPADVARERLAQLSARNGYVGASRTRRSLSEWQASSGDADDDILADLPELRRRSRDLARNNAFAGAVLDTKITSVVGAGFQLLADPDAARLGLTDMELEALTDQVEAEWDLWCGRECDLERVSTFADLCGIAYRAAKESGDAFALLPFVERPGSPYGTKVQLFEADRVSNPNHGTDSPTIAGGIERDDRGVVVACHIASQHPGAVRRTGTSAKWQRVEFFAADGSPQVLHVMDKARIGQSRGVPDLAPIIEPLRTVGRYTEAELMATVVSSLLTVFVKSEDGEGLGLMEPPEETGARSSDKDIKLGNAAVIDLAPGESVETVNPGRPNPSYEPFVRWMFTEIAARCQMPVEVVLKRFETSYTAARAAMNEVWRYYLRERAWFVADFIQPIYEAVFAEGVARGRIRAPGYLRGDPLIRRAYTRAQWIGPARGQINETAEMDGVEKRIAHGITTREEETAAITGSSWRRKIPRRQREARLAALVPTPSAPSAGAFETAPPGATLDD